jgi:hypothetical protein
MNKPTADLKRNALDFLYNLDRAGASLFGAPPQETISSEIGRAAVRGAWYGKAGRFVLDHIQKDHCENAVKRADALDATAKGLGIG